MLFTQEEAAELDLGQMSDKEWHSFANRTFLATRGVSTKGPRIEIMRPTVKMAAAGPTIETQSPTDLIVSFEQSALGKPVDMETLSVVGKKGFFSKTLTEKLKPFVVGSQIQASNLTIPKGKFHLQVSIADTEGIETVENYLLVVR